MHGRTVAPAVRRLGLILAAGWLCLVGAGCSVEANALESTASGRAQLAAGPIPVVDLPVRPVADSSITLVARGAEPHQVLTLEVADGSSQRIRVTQSGSQAFWLDDVTETHQFPVTAVEVNLTVVGVEGNGRTVNVEMISASSSPVDDDPVAATYGGAMINGLGGSTVIHTDARGAVVGSEPMIGAGGSGEVLALGYVERGFVSLADPLPSEPVGVGAVWEVRSSDHAAGFPVRVVRRYQLLSVTDEFIEASVERTVIFEAGHHQGAEVLVGSHLEGSGTVRWPRYGLVGVASYGLAGTVWYGFDGGGHMEQRIDRTVRSELTAIHIPDGLIPEPEPETETEPEQAEKPAAEGEGELEVEGEGEPETEVEAEPEEPAE